MEEVVVYSVGSTGVYGVEIDVVCGGNGVTVMIARCEWVTALIRPIILRFGGIETERIIV
jgi:hypothetical protein